MPKRSLSGGSLDPPKYSKISGLLQRLDSVDGMGSFGPIWASEAARAILGGPRGGAKCQNYSITADVCLQEGPNGSKSAYYSRHMRKWSSYYCRRMPPGGAKWLPRVHITRDVCANGARQRAEYYYIKCQNCNITADVHPKASSCKPCSVQFS